MTNNNNQYYIPKLPETSTIAYFDVETGQNFTQEEWNQLNQNNSDEIITVDKSGSNFISEKALNGVYGPGFWEGAWTVTKKVGGFALAVSYSTPIAPITGGATLAVIGSIELMQEFGNEDLKKFAKGAKKELMDVATTTMDCEGIGEGTAFQIALR